MKKFGLQKVLALLLAVFLCAGVASGCTSDKGDLGGSAGVILLSINPEIRVGYDEKGLVTEVAGANAEGKILVEGYTGYVGKAVNEVVKDLVERIKDGGYFEAEIGGHEKNLVIKVEKGSAYPSEGFIESLTEDVAAQISGYGYGSKPVAVSGDGLDGNGLISPDTAKTIVLSQLGLSEDELVNKEYKLENGKYEFEFSVDGVEYEYDIDASTGKIVEAELDRDSASKADGENAISAEDAKKAAFDSIGVNEEDCAFVRVERDGNKYEVSFHYEGTEYDFEIGLDGRILKSEKELINQSVTSGAESTLSADDAKKTALDDLGITEADCTGLRVELDEGRYEVDFVYGGVKYEYDINAANGEIEKVEKKVVSTGTSSGGQTGNAPAGTVSAEDAKKAVFDRLGITEADCKLLQVELDDDGRYDISFHYDGTEYDFEVDAATGEIVKDERETIDKTTPPAGDKNISLEEAKKAAFDHAGVKEADCTGLHVELDDGRYEITFRCDGVKYEYDINAKSGAVEKVEKDVITPPTSETPADTSSAAPEESTADTSSADPDNSTADTSSSAPADSAISADEAKKAAFDSIGVKEADCTFVHVERDGRKYEVSFHHGGCEYDIEVGLDGRILKTEREVINQSATGTDKAISSEAAVKAALGDLGISEGECTSLRCEIDDGRYDVTFVYDGVKYEYDISARDGSIEKVEKKVLTPPAEDTSSSAPAESTVSADEAKKVVFDKLGIAEADCMFLHVELDEGKYEISFHFDGVEYDFEVSALTGEIVKDEREAIDRTDPPTESRTLSAEEAKKAAFEHAGVNEADCTLLECELDEGRYDITFVCGGVKYEYGINARTGKVEKVEKKNITPPVTAPTEGAVSAEDAKKAAFEHAGVNEADCTLVKCERDGKKYEVSFHCGGFEYEYKIDAASGAVLKAEKEQDKTQSQGTASGTVSAEDAKKTAFEHAGLNEADCRDVKCKLDDGKYEVSFKQGRTEYEYEIDARTGKILDFEKDIDD